MTPGHKAVAPAGRGRRAMSEPKPMSDREAIARIVDPALFREFDTEAGFPPESHERWQQLRLKDALAKADAILARPTPQDTSDQDVEGLIERTKRAAALHDPIEDDEGRVCWLFTELAQALSVLQARVGEVEKERDGLRAMIEGREQLASLGIDGHGTAVEVAKKFMRDRDAAEARAQAAEARVAEAREALTWIANTGQSLMSDHWQYRCEARKLASAALSRLNGEG